MPRSSPPLHRRALPAGCIVMLLAACAGPTPRPGLDPQAALASSYRSSTDNRPADDAQWWLKFQDAGLAQLVERALQANHDVRIAAQRVRQARAGATAQGSALWPTLGLTASASGSHSGLPNLVKQGQPDTRAYRGAVEAGWEIDIFGGNRAATRAADEQARVAAYGLNGAQLLVASEMARQYYLLQGARERLAIAESLARAQRDTENLTRSREREGLASRFDVSRASGEVASIEAQIPALRTLVEITINRITVLAGGNPSMPLPELAASPVAASASSPPRFAWPRLDTLPVGQPADLLLRRPDVLAAEHQVAAQTALTAQARAALLPRFFVNALFGREDLKLNGLDLAPVRYSNAALAFSLPLFNAGRLRAGVEAQSAREAEALLQYQKTVLGAVEDVEDSLVALREEGQRRVALQAAVAARQQSIAHAQSLYREGQIDLLQLLDLQRALLAAELSLSESCTQQALNAVQLYKALGGGWQQLPEVTAAAPIEAAALPPTRPGNAAATMPSASSAPL